MAARKKNEDQNIPQEKKTPSKSVETTKDISNSSESSPVEENKVDVHSQQISELQNLTQSLIATVKELNTEKTRDLAYYEALSDVKSATKALLVTQNVPSIDSKIIPVPKHDNKDCLSPCDCISDSCCTFDIILTEIRVSSMQNEVPGDSNLGSMEIRAFAHISGVGAVIPGMFSTLTLHKPIGNPALWTTVNTKIKEVTVPNNITKNFIVKVDGKEVEHTQAENIAFQRDEHGSSSGSISLNCCCEPPVTTIEIPFTAGGLGAGNRGSIEVRISAVKKCG